MVHHTGIETKCEADGPGGVWEADTHSRPAPFLLGDAALTPRPQGPTSPSNWNIRGVFVGNNIPQSKKRSLCLKTKKHHFIVDRSFRNFLAFSEGKKKKELGVWFLQFPFLVSNISCSFFVFVFALIAPQPQDCKPSVK